MNARELMKEGVEWLEKHRKPGYCPVCGKPLPKGRRAWCSDECYYWWLREYHWGYITQVIKDRDGHKCVECGAKDELEVHHIVPWKRSRDNSDENLITLCHECHMKAHRVFRSECLAESRLEKIRKLDEFIQEG